MPAYLINTSHVAATTVNLNQGRIILEPRSYCELQPVDYEKAKTIYNSKALELFFAETKDALELILAEELKEEKQNSEDVEEETEETEDKILVNLDTISAANVNPVYVPPVDVVDNAGANPDSTPDLMPKENKELPTIDDAKQLVKEKVDKCLSEGNLNDLKDLATRLEIPYGFNIGLNSLANKILDFIEK